MKKLVLLLLLGTGVAQAQITQEHKYAQQVQPFKLSTGEIRYAAYVPGTANQVRVYSPTHALLQQTTVPLTATTYAYVDYLSDKLFNTTADLEFMLYIQSTSQNQQDYAQVFTSAGASLLRVDSTTFVRIFNSGAGTKLVTYQRQANLQDYYSRVYALPGTQTALALKPGEAVDQALPFPNPAAERIQLPYAVPAGQVGSLTITDATGRRVDAFQVDATFDHLLLDTRALRPGVYLYQVQVGTSTSAARRFVVR